MTSSRPNSPTARSIIRSMLATSPQSASIANARALRPPAFCAVRSAAARSMSAQATAAPASAMASAIASPMPDPAPVTRAQLSFKLIAASSSAWRAMAADRLGVRRIGAHIDPPLPFALQRIGNLQRHAADLLDLDLDALAVLQGAEPLVVGAAGDDVAGVEGHDRRGELDEFRHPVLHVVGVVVVPQLAVVPEAHDEVVGLGDLVGGRDARPQWGEGVEGLAEPAAGLPGAPA